MIEGAIVLLVGVGIGAIGDQLLNRLLRRTGPRGLPKPPRCSCGDPRSVHDLEQKRCHGERLTQVTEWGKRVMRQCPCRGYDGPEPLPEFFAGELEP